MGCCQSEICPENIIDPPTEGPVRVKCKSRNIFSKDYCVHQDDEDGSLWMYIRRNAGDDNDKYVLESFHKDEEKEDLNQCLVMCKIDNLIMHGDDASYKTYDVDSDGDSDANFSPDSDAEDSGVQKKKWRLKTKARYYSDRSKKDQIAILKIKAKGVAYLHTWTETDANGEERHKSRETKRIKKIKYKAYFGSKDTPEEERHYVDIDLKGSLNHNMRELKWKGDVFECDVDGTVRQKPDIKTKAGYDPNVAILMAFTVCNICAPDDILGGLKIVW
eukprot:Clim_evm33s109 gene=Clim_evmTU33s109